MKCGACCAVLEEFQGKYVKRIPLYPDEVDKLISIAKKRGVRFKVIEDLIFPDILNERILVITYRINLDNLEVRCPFYDQENGCSAHDIKPIACQAYLLALKREDAFSFQLSVDPLCKYVVRNYNELKGATLDTIKEIFKEEYMKAEKFYKKNKKLQLKIKEMEFLKEIEILREISHEEFNHYLKTWERFEIRV